MISVNITITANMVELPDIPCRRVWIRAMLDNVRPVWMAVNATAAKNYAWPLDIGGYFPTDIKVNNVNELDFYFEDSSDKVCVIYEK